MQESQFNKLWIKLVNTIPKEINTCSAIQFRHITKVLFSNNHNEAGKRILLVLALLRPKIKYACLWIRLNMLTEPQIFSLEKLTAFLFDKKLKTDVNLFPSFTYFGTKYIGPQEKFGNMTFGEFCMAADYLNIYHRSNNPDLLDKFIIILYKPAHAGMGSVDLENRAKRLKRLSFLTKITIYHNFMLFMSYLVQHPKLKFVFTAADEKKQSKDPVLWVELVDEWVNNAPEKHEEKYVLNVMQVLFSLDQINKKNQKKTYARNKAK